MEGEKNKNKKKIIETDNVEINYDEATGNKIVNEFLFKETLGRGAYSKVKKCINTKTNQEYAVKIVNNYLLRKKRKPLIKQKKVLY